mgnify:CR=1 FL=1
MDLPDKTGKPDFEKKTNRMSQNRLKDVKSIECSNTVIRFQCSYCHSNYARKNSLDTHVKQKHKENLEDKKAKVESPDNNDNQTLVSATEFDDIEGTKQFDCLLCDNSYAKAETLEKHTSEVHRRKSNVQIEGISLNDQTNESQPPKAKKTKFEPSVNSDNKAIPPIAVHVQTDKKTFKCEICEKTFKCKDNYNLHAGLHSEKIHGNEICRICSKSFPSIDDLMIHMENNHPESIKIQSENTTEISNTSTRFQCSYCPSNYAQKTSLNTHLKQKHEENWKLKASSKRSANKFQFPYCENKYAQKHTLNMHVKKKHKENVITKIILLSLFDLQFIYLPSILLISILFYSSIGFYYPFHSFFSILFILIVV